MADGDSGSDEDTSISRYRERIVHDPIFRMLLWLGAPPLLNQLIIIAYNTADAYWLSQYSDVTVAVPRQTWPIIMLFQALAMALTAACLSTVSQYVGGRAYREASRSASRFFTVLFSAGGILCIMLLALREYIFSHIISTPPEIFSDVVKYSGIIALDIFLNYISLTFTTLLQSVGDTRRPSIVNAAAVSLNILLDPFLVLGIHPFPRLGVVGAALTDVMGKIMSVLMLTYIIRKSYPDLKIAFTRDIDFEWITLVTRISSPILVLGLTNGFAFLMQLRIVNDLGIIAATSYAIGFVIMDIVDAALFGLGGATAIMVGQSLGAGKTERAREVAYKSCLLVFMLVALGATVIYPIKEHLIEVFTDDPLILTETASFLQKLLPTLPFFGLFMVAMSTGRGSGHTITPTLIGIFRLWGIRVGLGYMLAFLLGMGSAGAWLAIALSNLIGGAAALIWIKYGDWTKPVVKQEKLKEWEI
ncbi:MAG: MATE family efflux transporter [Candidatus Bathyarchaeota archaeon]|nr:MATE family efflux transporter [Candidatus Bathyarchaeota archaeon]